MDVEAEADVEATGDAAAAAEVEATGDVEAAADVDATGETELDATSDDGSPPAADGGVTAELVLAVGAG